MCGRFTLRSVDRIRLALENRVQLDQIVPRYNIAPTHPVSTSPIHDRMPVIMRDDLYDLWLNPGVPGSEVKKLLEPFPSEEMKSDPVSSQVNYTDIDNEDLVKRVDVEVGTTPSLF